MTTDKKIIKCGPGVIRQLREAGAEILKEYVALGDNYGEREFYKAKRAKSRSHALCGFVAITDKYEFYCPFLNADASEIERESVGVMPDCGDLHDRDQVQEGF